MGDFIKTLFGGSDAESQQTSKSQQESSQLSQQTSIPTDVTPEAFAALRDPIAEALRGLLAPPTFQGGDPGTFAVGASGLENTLLQRIGQLTSGPSALTEQASGLLSNVIGGQFLDPSTNPFLQATINAATRPLFEQFQDVTLPRLQGAFTAAGQRTQPGGSSAFDRAAALAQRGLASAVGEVSSGIAGQNFQQERARQTEAVAQATQISQQDIQNTISGLQAAALPRLIEQFGVDQGLAQFNERLQTILQAIAAASGLPVTAVEPTAQGTSVGVSTGTSESQGTGSSSTQTGIIPTLLSPFKFGFSF
jgi:hypothetical protein